ncbi:MAG: radical SAM protein [Eubacteriaceae bacterium]
MEFNQRYSLLREKTPAEIVLLQGQGCFWKACAFCDYYHDASKNEEGIALNNQVLDRVTGETGSLVVLNSGSYWELPEETKDKIIEICKTKQIKDLTIESHWLKREEILLLRNRLQEIFGESLVLHTRIGIETFDEPFREEILKKGMGYGVSPEEISVYFDECCLLFGIKGQQKETFQEDVKIAKEHFKHIYINLFMENSKKLEKSEGLLDWFEKDVLKSFEEDTQLTVLLNNTDLGVGN